MIVTEWFKPHIKPRYLGWYHCSFQEQNPAEGSHYESKYNWWWDGRQWKQTPNGEICGYQNRYWRGIAK